MSENFNILNVGEEPKAEVKDYWKSIKVELLNAQSLDELQSWIPKWATMTWSDAVGEGRYFEDNKDKAVDYVFAGRVLPTAIESINLVWGISGIDLTFVTHILRHRSFTFSGRTQARDNRHEYLAVPESVNHNSKFTDKIASWYKDTMRLYSEMIDSGDVNVFDARFIMPRGMTTSYTIQTTLKDCLSFIDNRLDTHMHPADDNIIALYMYKELVKKYPQLKGIFNVIDRISPHFKYITASKIAHCTFGPDNPTKDVLLNEGTSPLELNQYLVHKKHRNEFPYYDTYRDILVKTYEEINELYYSMPYKYVGEHWTSTLKIWSDEKISDSEIKACLDRIEHGFSKFDPNSVINLKGDKDESIAEEMAIIEDAFNNVNLDKSFFINYGDATNDYTGILKGFAIRQLILYLQTVCHSKHILVSFGGDICGYNCEPVSIKASDNLFINKSGDFCVFTSNNNLRKDHIHMSEYAKTNSSSYDSVTIVVDGFFPIEADILATRSFANAEHCTFNDANTEKVKTIFTKDGKPSAMGISYIASPFFNDKEKEIRTQMIGKHMNVLLPDETQQSEDYDKDKTIENARRVFDMNINMIKKSDNLVYPKQTNDLGTLMEIGIAIKENKHVFSFDKGIYTMLDENIIKGIGINDVPDNYIIDTISIGNAILAGYNYNNSTLYYNTGILNDNIMLACAFKKVVWDDNDKCYVEGTIDMEAIQ